MLRSISFAAALGIAAVLTFSPWSGLRAAGAQTTQPSDTKARTGTTFDGQAHTPSASTTQPSAFLLVVPVPVVRDVPPVVPLGGELAPDVESIRDTLASATEAAIAEDGFDDLVERFVDADRNRLGRADLDEHASAVNVAAARVRAAWKAKFNDDLDIEDEGKVYGPYIVVQGMITRPIQPAVKAMPANEPEDYNLNAGREVAVVTLPAAQGLRGLTVVMIDEAFGWKIDVPNTINAVQLRDNLVSHLNALADNAAKWPANREEAIRFITHHVLLGIHDRGGNTAPSARR